MTTLGALALVYYRGLGKQDILAFSAGLTVVALCLTSVMGVLSKAALFYWDQRQHNQSVAVVLETSTACSTGFRPRLWRLPWVLLRWRWTAPRATVVFEPSLGYSEFCIFEQRAKTAIIEREFDIVDWLGLAKMRFRVASAASLVVLPHYGQLQRLPLLIRPSSGEDISDPRGEPIGDRIDMRQYTKGDSPRTILWKVFARTRRLMVRIPERALSMRPRVCLFLWCGEQDEAAAAVCRVALEQGLLGQQWIFGCTRLSHTVSTLAAAKDMIAESGMLTQQVQTLEAFLKRAQAEGYGQCIVAVPAVLDSHSAQQLRSQAAHSSLKISICFACDGFDFAGISSAAPARWRHWVFRPLKGAQVGRSHIKELSSLWASHPGEVMMIERNTGTFFADVRHAERQLLSKTPAVFLGNNASEKVVATKP